MHSPIGDWQVVGVFNWDAKGESDASREIVLDLDRLGLKSNERYTVFDFWQEKYCGTAQGKLTVSVLPTSVRLLGLKPFADHPMFLSTNRHITQGATDFKTLNWDESTKRLSGTFEGVADTDYRLKVLVPDRYKAGKATVSAGTCQTAQDGQVLTLSFHCGAAGPVNWSVEF